MALGGGPDGNGSSGPSSDPPSIPPRADLGPRILAAAGWTVFGLVAIDQVGDGPLTDLDEPLLHALPHDGAIQMVSSIATTLGDQIVLAAIALLGAVLLLRRRAFIDAGILVLAKAVSVTVVYGLKTLFGRLRPAVGDGAGVCCAFPSGHATESAMVFMLLAVLIFEESERWRPWAEGVAIGLALVVGTTRLILGVHWPTDVVAGWGLGWALAGTFLLLRAYLHRRAGTRWAIAARETSPTARAKEAHANARARTRPWDKVRPAGERSNPCAPDHSGMRSSRTSPARKV